MTVPLLRDMGHHVATPSSFELDLFDAKQVWEAVRDANAVLHLATRIPAPDRKKLPGVWDENDRLRGNATQLLVDGALSGDAELIVVPTVAFVYPPGPANESTPLADVPPHLRSALEAEDHFATSLTPDVEASHCALTLYMDRRRFRQRQPTATTLTCTLKMRADRSWPHFYARP